MFSTIQFVMHCLGSVITSRAEVPRSLRRRIGCSVLALCLSAAPLALAADSAPKTRLIVGSELDFPPFALVREGGRADGFTAELWEAVAREAHLDATIKTGPFHQILDQFRSGQIDVMINLAQSDERRRFADFSVPHVKMAGAAFIRKGDSRIKSEDDLARQSLIVIQADLAHDYARMRGWSNLTLVDTVASGMKLLATSTKHDAMLVGRLVGLNTIRELKLANIEPLQLKLGFQQDFAFAVRAGNAVLLARINDGLANVRASGAYDAIYAKWFGRLEPPQLTMESIVKYLVPAAAVILFLLLAYLRERALRVRWKNTAAALDTTIAERQEVETALRASEERFKAFMDRAPGIAFIKDLDGRYVYVNKTWEDIYALDWRGKTDVEIWPGDDAGLFKASDRSALEAGHASESFETVSDKDGRRQDWWVMKFPIVDGGGNRLLGGMAMDITEEKRRQEELAETHTALTNAMPGIARVDTRGHYVSVNDIYAAMLGFAPAELIGTDWIATVHADDRPRVLVSYERMLEAGKGEFESSAVRKDGSTFFNQVLMVQALDEEGRNAGCHCFMRDISERKAAEQALLDNESKLRRLTQAIPGAVYQYQLRADGQQGFLFVSDGIQELIGRSAAEVVEDFSLLWDMVLEEDKEALADSLVRSAETMTPWLFEGRIRLADQSIRWIRGHSIPEPRRADGAILWNGILTDVTERKRAELALGRLAAIVDSSGDAIISRGLDYKILTWNGAAERLFGYAAEEVIGQSIDLIIPPEEMAEVALRREQLVGGVQLASHDTVRVGRGGQRIDVSVTQSVIRDAGGKVIALSLSMRDISERKKTEAALRESEARFIRATTAGKVGVWELDYRTGVYESDDNLKAMFGYRPDELDTDPFKWLALIHPDDRHKVLAASDAVLSGELDQYCCELRMLCKDGSIKWTDVRGDVERDAQGRARRVSGTIVDVSARSQAELAVRASEQSIRRLYEISTADSIPFETRLHDLLRHACERLGVANGAVTRLREDSVELSFVHSPTGELAEGAQVPLCNAYCTAVFAAEEPVCFEHVGQSEFRRHPGYSALGFESYIGARIMVKGEVFGALCFVAKQPHIGSFGQGERDFIKLLSAWIGTEIARRQAEDYLQKSHDQIRQIIDAVPNFIFVKDRMGRFELANQAVAEVYGTTVDELVGKTDADFNDIAAEVDFHRQKDLEVMDSLCEQFISEETITDATGKVRWLQTVKRPILDETGRATRVLGVATDITARKQTEEALRRSEQHLKTAQSIAHLGSWEWNLATNRTVWSDENFRLFGYEPGSVEASHDAWVSSLHPDDRPRVLEHSQAALAGTGSYDIEYRVVHPNGEIRHVHALGEVFRDGSGVPLRMAGTGLDITAGKQAEEALRQAHDELERRVEARTSELQQAVDRLTKTEAMLHQAVEVADIGIFECDHDSDQVYYSPILKRILDLPVDQPASAGDYLSRVDREDRQMVNLAWQRAHLPSAQGHISLEHRIIRLDGSIGWVMNRAQTVFDGTGDARRPVRTVGAVLDITERKRAEQALRASEERLRHALAVGQMGIWERDLRTGEITWDDRVYDMLGFDKDMAISRDLLLAHVHPADLAIVENAIRISERDGLDYECEFRFLRPDGKMIWVLTHGGVRRDAQGVPSYLAGINFDITERKSAEEALRNLNEQLDQRVAQRTQELAESRAGLRALVAELTKTEERERRRLAVELHDTLAQSLAVVNMYLWRVRELLGDQANGAAIKELLSNLDRTVDDSIKYTRTLIGELSPPVLYDLGLPAAFHWLSDQMARHGLRVEVDGPTEGLSLAEGDAVFLFQCARELLWNVVKHGAVDRATVAYGRDGNRLSLVVADSGKGFDLQATRANGDGGSHFGLFSIRERVALRGGRFEVNSAPGAGTWVSIVIPIEPAEPASAKMAQPVLLPRVSAPDGARMITIMIVDDHKMVRQGLRRVLEEQGGFAVVGEAGDGARAVALARALHPAVVIMDVNMPTTNGIEATEQIIHDRPSTVVIGLSFGAQDCVVQAMQSAGAVTCIAKERAVEDISQAILDALAQRRDAMADLPHRAHSVDAGLPSAESEDISSSIEDHNRPG